MSLKRVRFYELIGETVRKVFGRGAYGKLIVRAVSGQSRRGGECGINAAFESESQFGSQISAKTTIFRQVVGLDGPVNSMICVSF